MADQAPNIEKLEEAFDGDVDLLLFFLTWVKHGLNATKAYQELHPTLNIPLPVPWLRGCLQKSTKA
jgi:hypothetical protein